MGVSLLVLVQVFNLGAWVLVKTVAHSAVDQGVRAGARVDVDPVAACEARASSVLGGALEVAGATMSCGADAEEVTATAFVPLRSWLPGLPDSSTEVSALARRERVP